MGVRATERYTEAVQRLAARPLIRVVMLALPLAVAAAAASRIPRVTLWPVVLGLVPWISARYLLSPLRWHAISSSGHSRLWHIRVYAEAEFLGVLSPARAGADLWRVQMLRRCGLHTPHAVGEIAMDRLIGGVGLVLFVAATGAALPPALLYGALAGTALALVAAVVVHHRREGGLPRPHRLPSSRTLLAATGVGFAYQLLSTGVLIGSVYSVGHPVNPWELFAVFGASQIAGLLPGVHGAGPREGALVYGLVSLGVPLASALGAISLATAITLLPPLLAGGSSLAWRSARRRRTAAAPA